MSILKLAGSFLTNKWLLYKVLAKQVTCRENTQFKICGVKSQRSVLIGIRKMKYYWSVAENKMDG